MSENIIMPKLGMTMKEGTVEEWFKSEGDTVNEGDSIVTISSEKLTQDVEAPASGTLLKINVQAGEEAKVKAVLGVIGEEGESTQQQSEENNSKDETNDEAKESDADNGNANQEVKVQQPSQEDASQEQRLFISPLARKMADKEDLDITRINGTGGNQRITKLDIQRVLENGYDQADHKSSESQQDTSETANLAAGNVGEGLSPMRKNIAQNMRQSLQNTAQLTLHRKVDADHLLEFKDKLKGELQNAGQDVKLTVTTLLAKAVVLALKDYGALMKMAH